MKNGVVKWFSERKGYGFLIGEDGTDVYFNAKCGPKNGGAPKGGDSILYDEATGDKGLWARSWRMPEQLSNSTFAKPSLEALRQDHGIHPARRQRGSRR